MTFHPHSTSYYTKQSSPTTQWTLSPVHKLTTCARQQDTEPLALTHKTRGTTGVAADLEFAHGMDPLFAPENGSPPTTKLRIWRHWRLPCRFHCPTIRRQVCPLTSKNPRDAIQEITQHCDDHCDVFGSSDLSVSGDGDMIWQPLMSYAQRTFCLQDQFPGIIGIIVTIMYDSVSPVITIVYHLLFKYMLYYLISNIMLST